MPRLAKIELVKKRKIVRKNGGHESPPFFYSDFDTNADVNRTFKEIIRVCVNNLIEKAY
jgi:hypothetical protein